MTKVLFENTELSNKFCMTHMWLTKTEVISESLTTFVISFQKTLSILLTQNRCASLKNSKFSEYI